jgi:hypothetical protein
MIKIESRKNSISSFVQTNLNDSLFGSKLDTRGAISKNDFSKKNSSHVAIRIKNL